MKKRIYSALLMLMFSAIIVAGGYIYKEIQNSSIAVSSEEKKQNLTEWKKPDKKNLEYYGLDEFDTTLPVVHIDTDGDRIVKENKIWAEISIMDQAADGSARNICDSLDYQSPITINLRGASSYSGFDKPQYRIKFYKKQGETGAKNYEFLGMGAHSEWVLNGPFLDRTLLRNRMIYQLSRELFEWAPDTRFCEVFVNGKYEGVYLAVEPVTNGETRLRLNEFGLLSGETAYVLKRDRKGTEENALNTYGKTAEKTVNEVYISYPSANDLTEIQGAWIEKDINKFEKVLYSDKFADPDEGYAKYIDVDCFVDYYILNEAAMNNDGGNLSTYVYKELGGKLQLAVWDFNNAFDNYPWFRLDGTEFLLQSNSWFDRLLTDRAFVERVVNRYEELRETVLSTEHFYRLIEEGQEELGDAIDRNFAVWGYTFSNNLLTAAGGESRDPKSYDEAVRQLKETINRRLEFLDEHLVDLYEGCVNENGNR